MDYEKLGFTPEEERLLIATWNYGTADRADAVIRIVLTNGAITLLLAHGVATGSWVTGGIALAWVFYNTVTTAIQSWQYGPRWGRVMTKLEALLERRPETQEAGPPGDSA